MGERGTSDALGGVRSAPFADKPIVRQAGHLLDRSTGYGSASVLEQGERASGRAVGGDFGRKRDSTRVGVDAGESILLAAVEQDTGRVAERLARVRQSDRWRARTVGEAQRC